LAPLALARLVSGACKAAPSRHTAVLAFGGCVELLAWWLAVRDGAELADVDPLDPHAAASIVMATAAAAAATFRRADRVTCLMSAPFG
jgi:hypothetical protein